MPRLFDKGFACVLFLWFGAEIAGNIFLLLFQQRTSVRRKTFLWSVLLNQRHNNSSRLLWFDSFPKHWLFYLLWELLWPFELEWDCLLWSLTNNVFKSLYHGKLGVNGCNWFSLHKCFPCLFKSEQLGINGTTCFQHFQALQVISTEKFGSWLKKLTTLLYGINS